MKGLPNLGNTCYFSCAIQCLLQIPVVANYFIRKKYTGDCEFTLLLQDISHDIWIDKNNNININKFINLYKIFINKFNQFKNSNQHDVQETFICILDILDTSTTVIKNNFYSKVKKEIIHPNGKTESFEDTTVHFVYPTEKIRNIKDMMKANEDWSTLTGYTDDDGNTYNVAVTRTVISSAPKILIFSTGYRSKIELTPDIESFGATYKYISSAVHIGDTRGGHYVSVGRHKGRWYLKDDLTISEIETPLDNFHYLIIYYKTT
jgi:ubiquitin C-terminal hydrolase